MKFLGFLLLGFVIVSYNAVAQQQDATTDQFFQMMGKGDAQLLDVRTAGEYKSGHIKNAFQADWMDQQQFADRTQYLDRSKPVLVYCASGGRSAKAATWLSRSGFNTVVNLKGGITQWKLENRPVEGMPDTPPLTMEQYNQYISGSLPVLIDFGADWCLPCKKMEPVLSSLQQDLKDQFRLVKVDGGIHTNLMKQLNIAALPTFIIYKNGAEIWRKQGITDIKEIKAHLK